MLKQQPHAVAMAALCLLLGTPSLALADLESEDGSIAASEPPYEAEVSEDTSSAEAIPLEATYSELATSDAATEEPVATPLAWYDHVTLESRSKLSAGAALRVQSQNPALIGIANGGTAYSTNSDDGNQKYDRGDIYASAVKINSRVRIGVDSLGVILHGSAVYDPMLNTTDFLDGADFTTGKSQNANDRFNRTKAIRDKVGADVSLLEGYVFADIPVGDRTVDIKVGSQVVNWGESTFVQNGLNSLIAVDAAHLRTPGFEVDELFIPQGMVHVGVDLMDNVTLKAFYQYDWKGTQADPSGTFFSTNDFVAIGGDGAEIGFGRCGENSMPGAGANAACPGGSSARRRADNTPKDGGQGGVAINTSLPILNEISVAAYAANYHSRLPLISGVAATAVGVPSTSGYIVEYPENIKMYGVSFNTTTFWGMGIQGEYSYKLGQPLQVDDVELLLTGLRAFNSQVGTYGPGEYIRGWRRHDVSQYDMSLTKLLAPHVLGIDELLLLGETAVTYVHDMPAQSELRYEGPGTFTPGDAVTAANNGVPQQTKGFATATSYGYKLVARAKWEGLGSFGVTGTLRFDHDLNGTTPTPLGNFVENRKLFYTAVELSYLDNITLGLDWTQYFGGGNFNLVNDRDNVSMNVKYSF